MKKLNHRLTKFIQDHWIGSYFLAILLLAIIINIGMQIPVISFNPSLDAPIWLTFWGSYLGGAIGCLPAIAAYRHSIDESKRQIERDEANHRLNVRPILNISFAPLGRSFYKLPYISFSTLEGFEPVSPPQERDIDNALRQFPEKGSLLSIKNLGFGHALNATLTYTNPCTNFKTIHYLGTIERDSLIEQLFYFSNFKTVASKKAPIPTAITYSLFLSYEDVFCNEYKQQLHLILFPDEYAIVSETKPVLIKKESINA